MDEAIRFLTRLDSTATAFHFQAFDDSGKDDQKLVAALHGTLEQHYKQLMRLSESGAGVFVAVNAFVGRHRRLANLDRLRVIFQEADVPNARVPPLDPHIVVESSPGKFHRYWLLADQPSLDDWSAVMRRMVADYDSDPYAVDASRVLRLPGFPHQKQEPRLVRIVEMLDREPYSWAELTSVIPPLARPRQDREPLPSGTGITEPMKLASALSSLDPDHSYGRWISTGMALHHACNGGAEGLEIWDSWSANGNLYRVNECETKWRSFGRSAKSVTLGSVFHCAKEQGWRWNPGCPTVLAAAVARLDAVREATAADVGAALTPAAIEAARLLPPAELARHRDGLKKLKVSMKTFDATMKEAEAEAEDDEPGSLVGELLATAVKRCELWHNSDKVSYASFDQQGHREHWPLDSEGFRKWLARLAYAEFNRAVISDQQLGNVIGALSGIAEFDGPEYCVGLRVGQDANGIWIDLCDADWRAVLVTATEWRVEARPSFRFRRTKSMRPLPEPKRDGDFDQLWQLVNVPEPYRLLVTAWMLESLRPGTPYPVLELFGGQGAAKSTTQRVLRQFIDPNEVALRTAPKNREEIFVSARNNHLLSFENLSHLPADMSDALCVVSTGGGMASRQFYTNDEENLIKAHCPTVLNGINEVITRQDLLERAIIVQLPTIETRLTEAEHAQRLEQLAPDIMGGLLELLSRMVEALPHVEIPSAALPRLADFARLGAALSWVLGREHEDFMPTYHQVRQDALRRSIEGDAPVMEVLAFIKSHGEWSGSLQNLLSQLEIRRLPGQGNTQNWPRSAKGLSNALRRAQPGLRELGLVVVIEDRPRRGGVHCHLGIGSYLEEGASE
jgi:hypothetical protein